VLHAFYQHDANPLKRWLAIAPRNCVTVLDTHDGIGIVDVAGDGDKPGLLDDDQIDALVEGIHERTEGSSRAASGHAASNLDVYQVNSTYYHALGRADDAYLLARAIQLFAPGTPQIYYVGLLAGENDVELLQKTGVGRDINRHYFNSEEIDSALQKPVVQSLFDLIRLRNESPAFDGSFTVAETGQSSLSLHWTANDAAIALEVDLAARAGRIVEDRDGHRYVYEIGTELRKHND
jgi:sucrose phosphorylase